MASLETTKGLSRRDRRRMQQYANTVPTERITYWDNSDKTLLPAIRNVYSQTYMNAPTARPNPIPIDLYANIESAVQTAPSTRKRRTTNGSYKIQKGDTLSAIAKRYGTTVQAIAEANGITDVNKIYVGDSLNIPGNAPARTTSTPSRTTNTTVQSSANNTINNNQTPSYNKPYKVQADRPYNTDRDFIYSRNNYQNTPEIKEGERGLRQQNFRQSVKRIDLAQQVGRVTKQSSTTNKNNNFSTKDIQIIRQDQNKRPAVIYNTRSKPSLRRYQRYSRTGDTKAIKYNKNRPRTWNDYKNLKGGWIRELYG